MMPIKLSDLPSQYQDQVLKKITSEPSKLEQLMAQNSPAPAPATRKYHNAPTKRQSGALKFQSRKEAKRYDELVLILCWMAIALSEKMQRLIFVCILNSILIVFMVGFSCLMFLYNSTVSRKRKGDSVSFGATSRVSRTFVPCWIISGFTSHYQTVDLRTSEGFQKQSTRRTGLSH